MFSQISWSQYIIFLIVALVLYYTYVLLRYYRRDFTHLFSGGRRLQQLHADDDDEMIALTNEEDYPVAMELVQSVSQIIRQASAQGLIKEELMMSLAKQVRNYPQLKGTAFQVAVNNKIEPAVLNSCGIELTAEDLKRIW